MQKRLESIQKKLQEKNIDAVLITSNINRAYITGFYGTAGYALITHEKAYLLVDFRYFEQARKQAVHFHIIEFQADPIKEINRLLKENNIQSLGFEGNRLTYKQYEDLNKKLTVDKFLSIENLMEEMRIIKDKEEIKKIQEAAKIADIAFEHILKVIKPGKTEKELALELEFIMKKNGAQALSFDTIVVSGVRSSLPHGQPSSKVIEEGDLVTMDFGCVFEGYCSDMTRTIGIGHLNDRQKEIYNIVLEAQQAALDVVKEGMIAKEVDKLARDIITSYGYGKNFGHSLGHGVGCEIHEAPTLSPKGEKVLKPGMVVTIEPGIYIEDFGGVRIEDMILITEEGIHNFTSSLKELYIL